MGWYFLLFALDAGVPVHADIYIGTDEQRCLTVAQEHLESETMVPGSYVEIVYIGCVQGSPPRRK
jgi:hypothetical protein